MCTNRSTNSLSRSSRSARSLGSLAMRPLTCAGGGPARLGVIQYPPLEIQTTFTGRIGKSLDATVKDVARAIENDLLDASLDRALSDETANFLGGIDGGTG